MDSPSSSGQRAYKRSTVLWPLALITTLVVVKTALEHHPDIRELENWTYQFLQQKLIYEGVKERPDVLVINIGSKIKQEPWELDGRTGWATPRKPLQDLIQVFADLGAKSIGIDVDFSPSDGHWMHPGDPKFFDWCLQLWDEKHIPILLGVERTRTRPDRWLGDDRYMRLAAAIASPVGAHQQAVLWFHAKSARAPLLSMAAALAGFELSMDEERSFSNWAVKATSRVQRQPNLPSTEFTIDFASLKWIKDGALTTLSREEFEDMKDKIQGRMILIGDTNPVSSDLFNVPGLSGQIPGVFLHACAAHTLVRHPLYHLTLWGRIVIDVVTALLLFGLVQLSLWLTRRYHSHFVHAEHLLSYVFAVLAIVIVFVISVFWVHKTRLLWTDFVLFCAGLLAHPVVDSVVAGGRRLLAKVPRSLFRSAATTGLLLVIAASSACEQRTNPTAESKTTPVPPPSPTPAYKPAGRTAQMDPPADPIAIGSPTYETFRPTAPGGGAGGGGRARARARARAPARSARPPRP